MRLKLKQMMAVSLSVAMLLAVAPGEAVFANVKQDNIVNTKLMSGDPEKSGGGSEASEYGNLVGSDTISGSDITWSVYDSGKLVIEGTGATPDWSPWFEYKE